MKASAKICLVLALLIPGSAFAATVSVSPENPIQGDPIMISVAGATSTVSSISFAGTALGVFAFNGIPTALYGVDINKKAGTYAVKVSLGDGSTLVKDVEIGPRAKVSVEFSIPQKLGGNTATSAAKLVDTLALENAGLLNLRTFPRALWTKPFAYPVKNPVVTDTYGYSRATSGQSVTHKGTDFRAPSGTPVYAANRGIVRVARYGRNYGNTIVVDHGLGLETLYMHLSKIKVNVGELVQQGQVIGYSGATGYAEQAHLHLSVRVKDISIDPMRFYGLFK